MTVREAMDIMPQAQFDALWDWCQLHNIDFPEGIEVV